MGQVKLWKTVKLGTHRDAQSLLVDLMRNGVWVSDWAAAIMENAAFVLAKEGTVLNLANASAGDLGFDRPVPFDAICARALERGLLLCPAEAGPQLRRQYLNQPGNDGLLIAMKAIDAGGILYIFGISRYDGAARQLCTRWGDADRIWRPDCRFVWALSA